MATKQYNSPLAMYSEDIIDEIMTQVKSRLYIRLDTLDAFQCR